MILKPFTDPGRRVLHCYALISQQGKSSDAGKLQYLRRANRSGRQDDFVLRRNVSRRGVFQEFDANGSLSVETIRWTRQPVRMVRFWRAAAGFRNARDVLMRRPFFCVTWK